MTHEQKPESAEFRTREEIEMEMRRLLTHGVRGPNAAMQVVHRIFDEVRAFGASEEQAASKAEQRRKDAEGAELVGYVRPDLMEFFRESKALFTSASIIPKRDETHTEALYSRPANVAAFTADAIARAFSKLPGRTSLDDEEGVMTTTVTVEELSSIISAEWNAHAAMLEARVKELEAQRGAMQCGAVRRMIHSPLSHFKPDYRA